MFNETAYDLAVGAGCSPEGARIAAAIAQAESSGIPTRYNPETAAKGGTPIGKGSYGLWQIYLKMHPEFAGQNLYDPATNAAAMFSVSGGCQNWQPWSTYNNGAYRKYLTNSPVASTGGPQGGDSGTNEPLPTPDGENSAEGLETTLSNLPSWLPIAAVGLAAYLLLK